MRDHVTRRPMPVEQSILWKPLRDSHYVVASLQPADGGRRRIFIRQQVVARVEALVRAHGRRTVGLLLGQLYQCSTTGADYLVIESISEHEVVGDENDLATTIGAALEERSTQRHGVFGFGDDHAHVLGWYRGVTAVEARPSLSTAGIHASLFGQPWQTTLVISEGARPEGALFLHDVVNSRWFYAPFYELLSHAPAPDQPKATVINWPQYMTAEPVVPSERAASAAPVAEMADVRAAKPYERPWLRRPSDKHTREERSRLRDGADSPLVDTPTALTGDAPEPVSHDGRTLADQPVVDRPVTNRPAPRSVQPGLADASRGNRERPGSRRGEKSTEKLSIVDDRDQKKGAPPSTRRLGDDDDTVMGEDPDRYIEIARAEGFFIAAKFDAAGERGRAETLWVLNEPYSGLLLAVVGAGSEVVDATLHYNLQTDDGGLQQTPFPEHRDPESKTIYVRETCMDSLRARCRRLRATNALLREWKVTPPISFLTPGEWESIPVSGTAADGGVRGTSDLNKARIAELPPGVRSQFHLPGGESNA